jgi:hypothetical protein
MPNPHEISLDVRNFPATEGWKNTQASNGQAYSYKYTGGDPDTNDGTLIFTIGNGNAAVNLNLIADARYNIDNVSFTGDNANQLTARGNAPGSRVINDQNTEVLNASYKVTVMDTGNNDVTIPCDPPIINKYPSK